VSLINHEGGHLIEEGAEKLMGFGRESGFGEGVVHKMHPTIAGSLIDAEGEMARAKARMTPFRDVVLWTAKTIDQEIAQTLFRSGAFVRGIHGTQNVVISNLAIEGSDQASESIFSNDGVKIFFVHGRKPV
jgi:hypothetical protein